MHKLFIVLLCSLMLVSCGNSGKKKDSPLVCVTIEPLRMFTEAIAGDRFNVVSIVPAGSSPETYDPTPQQVIALAECKAYFKAGYLGFELSWSDNLEGNNPGIPFFDTSEGINLIREDEEHHHGHKHKAGVEPHVWNSTANAALIADNICKGLKQIDPEHSKEYQQRTDSLKLEIKEIDTKVRTLLTGNGGSFLIYHPALSYFARDYGLRQISIEEGGKEPSPAQLQQLIKRCKEENVKVIFIQKEFDARNAELIANELGLEVIPINPLSYDWGKEMISIAEAFTSGEK